jgi:MmyB-like transcription regulator ligand binding domain
MLVDWPAQARRILAAFRTSYAQHVGDPAFEELVAELTRESATFARLWSESTVLSPTEARSARFRHPTLGAVSYDTVTFLIPEVPEATVIFGMLDPAEPEPKLR